jgi:hypothetical protein
MWLADRPHRPHHVRHQPDDADGARGFDLCHYLFTALFATLYMPGNAHCDSGIR